MSNASDDTRKALFIKRHAKRLIKILSKTIQGILDQTISFIFGSDCSDCIKESGFSECFIPFVSHSDRIFDMLILFTAGAMYTSLKIVSLEWVLQSFMASRIEHTRKDWQTWKKNNCKFPNRKVD